MLGSQGVTTVDADLLAFSESIGEVLLAECDRRKVHGYFDRENDLDRALWQRAKELGWCAVGVSEQFEGLGLGTRGLDVLFRALGRSLAPGPFLPTLVGAQWLSDCASAEVASRFIPRIVAGELALGVPAVPGGSSLRLEAGRIKGESEPLLIYPWSQSCILPVSEAGQGGFALVPIGEGHAEIADIELWDRTSRLGRVKCPNVAPSAVIWDPSGKLLDRLRRHLALAIAADCLGGARAIAEQTLAYLKERQQFGRPLASFQALKHRVADLHVAIVAAEQSLEHAVEAAAFDTASASVWAALAKAAASDAYFFVASDCLQLHGGVGFTWQFDCHLFLKRALLNRQLGGDNDALRDFAAERLSEAAVAGTTTAEFA
jgi:alkylation response protein AidB-like acyl-CoA dehydrogenase